jgi:hypothetical protein
MNYSRFDLFEPIRFLTDVDDLFDAYVSSAQQSDSPLPAGLSLCVRTLCAEMEFVFAHNFAVCFYACDASTTVEVLARIRKRGFLITRRFDGESFLKAGSLVRSIS